MACAAFSRVPGSGLPVVMTLMGHLDELLKGVEVLLESHYHDIVVGCCRDDEELLSLASQVLIEVFRLLDRNERIPLSVHNQGRSGYLPDHLNTFRLGDVVEK